MSDDNKKKWSQYEQLHPEDDDEKKLAQYEQYILDRIDELREEAGLPKSALSFMADHSQSDISSIERDTLSLSLQDFLKTIIGMNITLEQFFSTAGSVDADTNVSPQRKEWNDVRDRLFNKLSKEERESVMQFFVECFPEE